MPVDELAQKIIAKADAFALASGALIGQRQWYEDALESLGPDATTAQIEDITVSYSAAAVATQEATDFRILPAPAIRLRFAPAEQR